MMKRHRSGTLTRRLLPAALCVIVLVLAAHAVMAVRSQHDLSRKVMEDYAGAAAWYFEQNLEREFATALECAFHEALHVASAPGVPATLPSGGLHEALPSPALLRQRWFMESSCAALGARPPAAAFRFGPAGTVAFDGEAPSATELAELRALVEAAGPSALRRTDGIATGRLGGHPAVVLYSRQSSGEGEAVYAVVLERDDVSAIASRALRGFRLLPPPVVPDSARANVFRIALRAAGDDVFAAGGAPPTVAAVARPLDPRFGGLGVRTEITRAGAAILAQPPAGGTGLHASLALLCLSLTVLALTFRQLRREEELSRLRADFVAGVSHDLRTPLALQRVFLDTLRLGRADSPERQAWAIQNIDREARRLEHLVSNVLNFDAAERGNLRLELHRTAMLAAVGRIVAALRPLAEQRNCTVEVSGDPELHADVDEPALHQAVANVIDNALRYGPEGQNIAVVVERRGSGLVVQVTDEGPGIPADERLAVMQPYRRGRAVRGGPCAGSGIGLAVVADVLRAHGGGVELHDAPHGGLCVLLLLPLAEEHQEPAPAVSAGHAVM